MNGAELAAGRKQALSSLAPYTPHLLYTSYHPSLYTLLQKPPSILNIYILHTALQAMPKMYFQVLLILILSDLGIFTGTTVTKDHFWIWA